MGPSTQYAKCGDINGACRVGPIDLVYAPGWVSNLDYAWEYPAYARVLERLGAFARLIRGVVPKKMGIGGRLNLSQCPRPKVRIRRISWSTLRLCPERRPTPDEAAPDTRKVTATGHAGDQGSGQDPGPALRDDSRRLLDLRHGEAPLPHHRDGLRGWR